MKTRTGAAPQVKTLGVNWLILPHSKNAILLRRSKQTSQLFSRYTLLKVIISPHVLPLKALHKELLRGVLRS